MKKKILARTLFTAIMLVSVTGCSSSGNLKTSSNNNSASNDSKSENTDSTSETSDVATSLEASDIYEGEYTIGISQFAEHASLDNCREGFLAGLSDEGFVEGENLTVEYQNAQTDTGMASTIADAYVSEGVDLICAIATPAAMSAYNSCLDTDIPVIYTAISDPVGAGLANEDKTSTGNITGTSDALPIEQQLQMIRDYFLPDATKIGIIYTTSEANSVSTIAQYEEIAGDYGFEIVSKGIGTISDVDMAAASLCEEVDCICNLTDNTVVSALQTVLARANEAGIPVFGSEVEQVKNGCVAAMGIDYYELGVQTGRMAAKVLKGEESAGDMEYEVIEEASLYVNTAAADIISLEVSDEVKTSAAEVYTEITTD